MSAEYQTVAVERDGSIGTVRVARPDAMNAVNTQVLIELADAIDALSEEVQTVVLTGEGDDAFIGGGDIKEFQDRSGIWFRSEFREAMGDLEDAIEGSHVPVVAAVNGVALGGGTEIALMCDLIVATESARFGLPEIGLGIIPGAGGTQRLAHLVGYLKAKELILTGKHISASEAADIGLANEVVDDEEFEARIDDLAAELADGPPVAQWFAKKSINETRAQLDSGLELEAALAGLLFETEDKEEGLAAFVEKRDPSFGE
ncbi:enoyl-CoA hydratase/isomerase family protein [Halorientalis salina]|uniref:enoyl-CoA hydratase/isomerase family protein n=1 Tax=Halorientalis salina TaxID=2932266 RepID=UPI0010AC9B39|nr:enoyl-CoA hydratase/isomerase family protein [Halorientalis salina]